MYIHVALAHFYHSQYTVTKAMVEQKNHYTFMSFLLQLSGGGGVKKKKNETEIGKNLFDNIAHTLSFYDI